LAGRQYADDWGTSYAGHFLLEAGLKGYALPVNFLPAGRNSSGRRRFVDQAMPPGT